MADRPSRLVGAICPPALPAGIAPAVVDGVNRALAASGPLQARLLGAALAAMSAGIPVPSTLATAVRRLVLTVAYEQPEVHAALGYDPAGWVARTAAARRERWAREIDAAADALFQPDPLVAGACGGGRAGSFTSARDLDDDALSCDVVVVGSGAGGAVVAAELAEAGWDVVVLEDGPYVPTGSFPPDALTAFRTLYREGGLTTMLGTPPVAFAEGRSVGGSTTVNGGMAWRTPDAVLERWRADHALDGFDPVSLAPLFERVERRLSVATQDPGSIGRDQDLLRLGAQRLGWAYVDNRRAQVHCGGCNACVLGCPTGAKQSTLVSYLPRAVAFGAAVVSDCRVDAVLLDGKRATGVRARGPGGRRLTVRAGTVVLAAGALQTPALLSRSGFRSPSGQLGRNLAVHPGANVAAVFDEPVRGWEGVHQAFQVREFAGVLMAAVNLPPGLVAAALPVSRETLGQEMQAYDRMVTAGVLVDDTATGRVRVIGGRPVPVYDLAASDAARIVDAVGNLCRLLFAAGAVRIHLPFAGLGPVTRSDEVDAVVAVPPARMTVSTVHLMGTARMGGDPATAVCDPAGRVHDAVGLRIADASLLPTPVGINPMETIMVLATLVARDLITRGKEPA
jgi:ferredoxin